MAPGAATALVVLIFVMLLQGDQTYGGVIADGPQSAYLSGQHAAVRRLDPGAGAGGQ